MPHSSPEIIPQLTSRTVFFIGNGVLRVEPSATDDQSGRAFRGPSWSEYMENLWSFIRIPAGAPGSLSLEDFTRLSAPRQAEWFDREFQTIYGTGINVAALRLHLLGRVLHPDDSILSNPLFRQLASLIIGSAGASPENVREIDVITTNVDCALEQNIARAIEQLGGIGRGAGGPSASPAAALAVSRATIEAIVDFRLSGRWEISGGGSGLLRVRLWKIHGCLRDLKIQMSGDREMTRAVLNMADDVDVGLCGNVPTDRLAADLSGDWRQTHYPDRQPGPHNGVFSQSEYFRNLLLLARSETEGRQPGELRAAVHDEQWLRLAEFRELLASRPLIFVGYSIPEVDVDVVYALQQYRQRDARIKRWQLLAQRERSASTDERLRQLGIDPWPFGVAAIGFASVPGKLRAARRHEWRSISADPLALSPDKDWRRALERVAAQAWLEPQLRALQSLDPAAGQRSGSRRTSGGHRLVVAGLASIWHGIALTKSADFPVRRRVSARLISVDAQVPGGSGLVPVMVAAAAAGPAAVGSLAFFSNVPGEWSNWEEIEDMCLSAGISVHAWDPGPDDNADGLGAVARTSHVILFDPTREDADSYLPRQRFIMDVQALANEGLSHKVADWSALRVPPARPLGGFQKDGQEDFLFVDKETDPDIILGWKGPTVYETGASGDELVTQLQKVGARPTIWTAGVGSFVRTMVALAGRVPSEIVYASGPQGVLEYLEEDSRLASFAKCGDLRDRYLAKVVSFGRSGIWDFGNVEGFTYFDELQYGIWLREHWAELEAPIWELLGRDAHGVLAEPHPRIGGGALTTIHDGGLMAAWRWHDGQEEQVSIRIDTSAQEASPSSVTVRCAVAGSPRQACPDPIVIRVSHDQMTLAVGDLEESLQPSPPIRRNTLAAGDTVRGAMAYGLWAAAYRLPPDRPADLQRIFLAGAALASMKCYAGSFVDFLKLIERLRGTPIWAAIWNFD